MRPEILGQDSSSIRSIRNFDEYKTALLNAQSVVLEVALFTLVI
jgi:hypothetical protein